jgi:hypothetical protein
MKDENTQQPANKQMPAPMVLVHPSILKAALDNEDIQLVPRTRRTFSNLTFKRRVR